MRSEKRSSSRGCEAALDSASEADAASAGGVGGLGGSGA